MRHLQHDTAMALAATILEMMSPCLTTESERGEAFGQLYDAAMAAIQKYHELLRREDKRLLRPSAN
ncbi:MAG: hypothetical protein K8U57_21555 [Planctomycetes bacterium]|nr:hypothetical protein [Planctomycetota bacterium]